MKPTIRLPQTLWKTATTLALLALTAGTALAIPSPTGEEMAKNAEVSQTSAGDEVRGVPKEGEYQIPEMVPREHWAFKEITELGEKYGAGSNSNGEQPVTKNELTDKFIVALSSIVEKYDKEGGQAVSRDDMESIRRLIVSLEDELFGKQAYRTIRTTIEQLLVLVEPAVPLFKYKVGLNVFYAAKGLATSGWPT